MTWADREAARAGQEGGVDNGFRAPWWLKGGHAQTLWAGLLRPAAPVALQPEPLELPDGDDLRLFWGPPAAGPVVVVLHGLGGCARSPYVLGLLQELAARDVQGVVMQFRGAGGHLNRQPRFFHAGAVGDLEATVAHVRAACPGRPLGVVGFSMGGIITLNWLGHYGAAARADAAVAVSAPLDLARSADHLATGFRRVYDRHLVGDLMRLVRRKHAQQPLPLPGGALRRPRTLREFDDRITAPLHGFRDAADYYGRCSPVTRLAGIRVPTRIIHALDDPFVPAASLPDPATLPAGVRLELSAGGGHVAFVTGPSPGRSVYWLDGAISERLEADLARHARATEGPNAGRPPYGGLPDPVG